MTLTTEIMDTELGNDATRLRILTQKSKAIFPSWKTFWTWHKFHHFLYLLEWENYQSDNGQGSRRSNDLVICFVKFLTLGIGIAKQYGMPTGKTGAMIHHWAAFDTSTVPHEIGHILGASHGIWYNSKSW